MKDKAEYLLHNTNVGNKNVQGNPILALIEIGRIYGEHTGTVNDKHSIMYSLEDVKKNDTKTKFTNRPKSAGEAMMQPKATVEGFLMKRSISLSNIEEFFLKRRIPLIKPLISEREIVKLRLLQENCRKKRIGSDTRSSQKLNLDDIHLKSDEEKTKDKARDVSTPFLDSKVKNDGDTKQGDGRQKESEGRREIKTPASGRSKKNEAKKVTKRVTSDKLKSPTEKRKKKEKQETSDIGKKKIGLSSKSGTQLLKSKAETSSKSDLTTKNNDSKVKDDIKPPKRNEKHTTSKDEISSEGMKSKDSKKDSNKGTDKQSSGHKSEKDIPSKSSSGHSKDNTTLGRKSDKSNKSDKSSKSRKMSDLPKEINKKDKGDKDEDKKNQLAKTKSQFEDSQNSKDNKKENASSKSGLREDAKKTKPENTPEEISDFRSKEKTHKTPGVKKSVKFPNTIQQIIHYVLSNPLFIKLGWTLSPSDRAPLQMVTFRAIPATPSTYCFRERPEDKIKFYSRSLGKGAYHFKSEGIGVIFYPSGVPAVEITKHDTGMRLTLFSDPKNDPLIKDSFDQKVLGIFDSYGNGVVYDMQGRKVLNYSQLEGILWTPQRKSPYKWQWCDSKILEKKQLKALLRYRAKEQKQPVFMKKEPTLNSTSLKKVKSEEKKLEVDEAYEQILAELPYPVVQKTKTKSEKQFWGFKPITLKINSEMTLRINGQDDISINFSSQKVSHRIDLGVKIDPDVVERIELLSPKRVSVSEVPCVFDALLNLSSSLQRLTHGSAQGSIKTKQSTR